MGRYDFDSATDTSLKELNNTIKENSKVTARQNTIMILLTVGIFAMAIVMILLMIVQIKVMR